MLCSNLIWRAYIWTCLHSTDIGNLFELWVTLMLFIVYSSFSKELSFSEKSCMTLENLQVMQTCEFIYLALTRERHNSICTRYNTVETFLRQYILLALSDHWTSDIRYFGIFLLQRLYRFINNKFAQKKPIFIQCQVLEDRRQRPRDLEKQTSCLTWKFYHYETHPGNELAGSC